MGILPKQYFVYILTNKYRTVLYTGVTNDIARRIEEHRLGRGSGFTSKYRAERLIYYEVFCDVNEAIAREKQIKAGSRRDKIELIEKMNSEWKDLANEL